MVELQIDGKKVSVTEGSMIMHAAAQAQTFIPHFCYHKKLSIAANCRMCLVEVEKMPKAVPACATPVTAGMQVHTHSDKATSAQRAVMEFLLINHPLDCPICDQGGECQLQDLSMGYGNGASRFVEEKHVVGPKDVGPLISMQEMNRCIHCTRCVRFGQEIAGVMELGMANRGEHSEIETFVSGSVDSEISGNMIDLCPVGALTSKPFRYSARTWELSRRKSISPHDSCGANLIVQVKGNKVMRVVPFENEAVNECWIADRDRFSYEALNGSERATHPMLKQGGQWIQVDWQTALDYVVRGLKGICSEHGPNSIGALVSAHSTLEELYLAGNLIRGLGSGNIDYRLRNTQFETDIPGARWLGLPIADLSELQSVLIIGSNLRKDHPLFAQRLRQACRKGASLSAITSKDLLSDDKAWAMPLAAVTCCEPQTWVDELVAVADAVAQAKAVELPQGCSSGLQRNSPAAQLMAQSLLAGERKAIFLGNAAAHHWAASSLLALAQWLGEHTGAAVGFLSESANTVGAQLVGALPNRGSLDAGQMLGGALKGALLLGCEPGADSAQLGAFDDCDMVVTLSAFKSNMLISDVLLPISPFTETSGTFVNAEGRVQSFHAVVAPLEQTRPGWKVLRVLADLLGFEQGNFENSQEVLRQALGGDAQLIDPRLLSNRTSALIDTQAQPQSIPSVGIYALDPIVRRAPSLQKTADAQWGASEADEHQQARS